MKNLTNTLLPALAIALTLSACTKNVLRGEGPTTTETRQLTSFNGVEIAGNRDADIQKSADSKVEITGYANLISAYRSTVTNSNLNFGYPSNTWARNDNLRLKIYSPQLSSLRMSGNTTVYVTDGFEGDHLGADLSGNGKLVIGTATFNKMELHTSGNAIVEAANVTVKDASVDVSGSGKVKIKATETLKIRISGSGEVHYWGDPILDVSISGSGKAIRH